MVLKQVMNWLGTMKMKSIDKTQQIFVYWDVEIFGREFGFPFFFIVIDCGICFTFNPFNRIQL